MSRVFDNIFETVNSAFAQALYEDYLRDPASVPPDRGRGPRREDAQPAPDGGSEFRPAHLPVRPLGGGQESALHAEAPEPGRPRPGPGREEPHDPAGFFAANICRTDSNGPAEPSFVFLWTM